MAARLAALVLVLFGFSVNAQVVPPMEKVLIPIFLFDTVPGAYGSVWKSELVITNRSDQTVAIDGIFVRCNLGTCVPPPFLTLRERATVFAQPATPRAVPPGSFVLVEQARLADVAFSLRIQDISRQALTWGTELPVIPEGQAFTRPIDFLNVPQDDRFRVLLRVYDYSPTTGHQIRITGYAIDPTVTEPPPNPGQLTPLFSIEQELVPSDAPFLPGYAQIDLTQPMELPENTRLLVHVEPLTPFTYWAFINVTNNETQHVTVISPY